ncbi:hypothetical protein [Rhodococcus gordoniae]|uniref:hypothetical protein n=1 Tax=Rhodococcus gordoniae TaxID=223392 RepID=UPI0035235EEE
MTELQPKDASSGRPLTVLQSLDPPDGTTKYVVQVATGMPANIELKYFSWRNALFGKYDVFHVHWPEFLLRADNKLKTTLKTVALIVFLARLEVTRKAVVRTIHNEEPHESGGRLEKYLTGRLERMTSLFIRLNPVTPYPTGASCVTIPHGHYVDWFADKPSLESVEGRILSCGLIRPYKGIEELLALYGANAPTETSLRIVGKPRDSDLKDIIEAACRESSKVSARLEFVPDDDLVREIYESELVVLPYRKMHNSGIVFLALSLQRPVLVPKNEVNAILASEVGTGWINTFSGDISLDQIHDALAVAKKAVQGSSPNLEGRDWASVGEAHASGYETAYALRRART